MLPFFSLTRPVNRLFSRFELWVHVLSMPFWCAIGGYVFLGPRYFTDRELFLYGSLAIGAEYWFVVVLFTLIIRAIIRRYPGVHQTGIRTAVMMATVISLIVFLSVPIGYLFSLVPMFNCPFNWTSLRPAIIVGLAFDVIFCIVLGSSYLYRQWQEQWREKEQLKRATLQQQFDQLKGQVNPHFLFNSLTSLTELIGEDPQQAERFVEELAKVYRYLLQTNHPGPLTTLASELTFIRSYAYLLDVRYRTGIQIDFDLAPDLLNGLVPVLSLQVLVDNALKHNVVSSGQPLSICISTLPESDSVEEAGTDYRKIGLLRVRNNLQPKRSSLTTNSLSLSDLMSHYRLLHVPPVRVRDDDGFFTVDLPLLEPVSVQRTL